MPYRLLTNGTIECDTAEELNALRSNGAAKKTAKPKKKPGAAKGVLKSWQAAKKLAKAEGITPREARAKLAKAKKKG